MNNTVYVIGVFDLFHTGHLRLLKQSKALGKKLIVAINGDDMVAKYKRRPYYNEQDRLEIVQAIKYVDEAFIIRQFDNKEYIIKYGVNIIVHGDDWNRESYIRQIRVNEKFLSDHNVQLVFVPYTKGISTSDLIQKIRESQYPLTKS